MLRKARELNRYVSPCDTMEVRTLLAGARLALGDTLSAIRLIRPLPAIADSLSEGVILTYAAKIYLAAGFRDTAMMYAHRLARLDDSPNRRIGLRLMLSPKMRHLIPADSLAPFVTELYAENENFYNENDSRSAMDKTLAFNYSLHDRDRMEAERSSRNTVAAACVALAVIVLMAVTTILAINNRNKTRLIQLQDKLMKLEEMRENSENPAPDFENQTPDSEKVAPEPDRKQMIRDRINRELDLIGQKKGIEPSKVIIRSRVYERLRQLLDGNPSQTPDKDTWEDLDKVVTRAHGSVRRSMRLLTDRNFSDSDLRLVELTKCGFSNSETGRLMGLDDKTVWSRKQALMKRMFGTDAFSGSADNIFRLL